MISTYNEWDPLKRVVVGRADTANWPINDPVFKNEGEKTTWRTRVEKMDKLIKNMQSSYFLSRRS